MPATWHWLIPLCCYTTQAGQDSCQGYHRAQFCTCSVCLIMHAMQGQGSSAPSVSYAESHESLLQETLS